MKPLAQPCKKIKTACRFAGFDSGLGKEGLALYGNCINPIMAGRPGLAKAKNPLPQVDKKMIAECRAMDKEFGTGPIGLDTK